MYADLKVSGTVAVESEQVNSSHNNGAIQSTTSFNWSAGSISNAQLLSGSWRIAEMTLSTMCLKCDRIAVDEAVI